MSSPDGLFRRGQSKAVSGFVPVNNYERVEHMPFKEYSVVNPARFVFGKSFREPVLTLSKTKPSKLIRGVSRVL